MSGFEHPPGLDLAGSKQYLAWLRTTPVEALCELAQDDDCDVRKRVADNPTTPLAVKVWLSGYRESMTLQEFLEATHATTSMEE